MESRNLIVCCRMKNARKDSFIHLPSRKKLVLHGSLEYLGDSSIRRNPKYYSHPWLTAYLYVRFGFGFIPLAVVTLSLFYWYERKVSRSRFEIGKTTFPKGAPLVLLTARCINFHHSIYRSLQTAITIHKACLFFLNGDDPLHYHFILHHFIIQSITGTLLLVASSKLSQLQL